MVCLVECSFTCLLPRVCECGTRSAQTNYTNEVHSVQGNFSYQIIDFTPYCSCFILLYILTDYRLVIICSNEDEEKSHIISKLHSHKRPFALTLDSEQCQHYLKTHFTGQVCSSLSAQMQPAMASIVDHER